MPIVWPPLLVPPPLQGAAERGARVQLPSQESLDSVSQLDLGRLGGTAWGDGDRVRLGLGPLRGFQRAASRSGHPQPKR